MCCLAQVLSLALGAAAVAPYAHENDASSGRVDIPAGTGSIGRYAYRGAALSSVTIPASVTNIADYAFYGCTNLSSVTFASGRPGVRSIGERAFAGCTNLTSVTLPSSLKTLGFGAFEGSGLTALAFPAMVAEIPDRCCAHCRALAATNHVAGATVGLRAFYDTPLDPIVVPVPGVCTIAADVTSLDEAALASLRGAASIKVADGNAAFRLVGGVLYSADGKTLHLCPRGVTSVSVAKGVKTIAPRAFSQCDELETVTIPSTVSSIGDYAFERCAKLRKVIVNSAVLDYFGDRVFANCPVLAEVSFACNAPTTLGVQPYFATGGTLVSQVRASTKGWDGDAESTALPASGTWPADDGHYARAIVIAGDAITIGELTVTPQADGRVEIAFNLGAAEDKPVRIGFLARSAAGKERALGKLTDVNGSPVANPVFLEKGNGKRFFWDPKADLGFANDLGSAVIVITAVIPEE